MLNLLLSLKTLLFVLILVLLSACTSKGQVARTDPPAIKPDPLPAWIMEYQSKSLIKLDSLFSISASPSSETLPPLKAAKPTPEN